jgi:drug/metabolite transporter (DMT)-like permease
MALLGEPILATTYAAFIFREIPRPSFYAGTTLIVIGIALATREERGGSAGGTVSGTMTDP